MAQDIPPPLKFNITPSEISAKADALVNQAKEAINKLTSSITPDQATFENAIIPISHIENEASRDLEVILLLENVSPDPDVRKAASQAVKRAYRAYEATYANHAVFALIDAVTQGNPQHLDDESQRLLTDLRNNCADRGLKLPKEMKGRFSDITSRKMQLRGQFMENIVSYPGSLCKHEHELEGLSKTTLEGLEEDDTRRRRIPLHKATASAVYRLCSSEEIRRDVYIARERIYPGNAVLFREAVLIRDEAARMLGYTSFLDQLLPRRMMKTPAAVMDLLNDLGAKLQPFVKKEMEALQKLRGDGQPIHFWDFHYYNGKTLKGMNVDNELVAEYFPADFVLPRMLQTFERLFHLEIVEVVDRSADEVWHEDVKVFSVKDLVDGSFVGYLYTDLYPREGKYNHAADFSVRPSYIDRHGKYVFSATALICSVTPPTRDTPALLQHSDVITIFHELGHGMHDLMGRTKYASYHGWRGRRDFCEAPSQLLEYWCWVPETLKSMSCHYSYLSEKYNDHWKRMNPDALEMPPKQIPDRMVSALIATKQVNMAISTAQQVGQSIFDMKVHNPSSHEDLEKMDIRREYYASMTKVSGLQGPDDGTVMGDGYSTTPHFMWGQEANYYSYLSTRILAADMWKTCFAKDPMSREAGLRYRQMVLDKGGSVDEAKMVAAFLGREPTSDAYLEELGVGSGVVN